MSVVSGSFRERVRTGIEPLARLLGRIGLTPNALTLIGFGIASVAAWFAAQEAWLVAGLLVAFGAIFDLFDGAVARATGTTSRLGAFLDSTFDRAGESVVYIGIALGILAGRDAQGELTLFGLVFDGGLGAVIAMAAMGAAFMVSYTRAKSESLGFSSGRGMANVGLAPREVRAIILVIGLFVAGTYGVSMAALWPEGVTPAPPMWWMVLVGTLALIAILATLTTIQRILFVYRQSRNQEVND
jgi:phosphatidylglycerophosphate synthase